MLKTKYIIIFTLVIVAIIIIILNSNTAKVKLLSGVSGNVLLGPTCPVERIPPDPNCAEKPYKTNLVLTTGDGSKIIKEFSSDNYGKFSIEIQPGEYEIMGVGTKIYPRCSTNGAFKVVSNTYAIITVYCDTGIR